MKTHLDKLNAVFRPRVKDLDIEDWVEPSPEE